MRRRITIKVAVLVTDHGDYVAYGLAGLRVRGQHNELDRVAAGWCGFDRASVVKRRTITAFVDAPSPRRAKKGGRRG